MNKGDLIPDSDHVIRYVGGSKINQSTGLPSGVAFERKINETDKSDGPSFNWAEYFGCDTIENAVGEIRRLFEKRMSIGATAIFASLHVETSVVAVADGTGGERSLEFIYTPLDTPEEKDPSHVIAPAIQLEDSLITDILASTVIEVFRAKLAA